MSDELERLRTVNEAQADALRAVRELAEQWREYRVYDQNGRQLVAERNWNAQELLAILDGTATP